MLLDLTNFMGPYLEGGIYTGRGGRGVGLIFGMLIGLHIFKEGVYIWEWLIYGDLLTGFYSMLYEVPLKLIALVCLMSLAPK